VGDERGEPAREVGRRRLRPEHLGGSLEGGGGRRALHHRVEEGQLGRTEEHPATTPVREQTAGHQHAGERGDGTDRLHAAEQVGVSIDLRGRGLAREGDEAVRAGRGGRRRPRRRLQQLADLVGKWCIVAQ